jgi:single-strand DNA-binding protein
VNINTVALTGNLTRDPELRSTSGGSSVCNLSLAVNERTKVNGEWTDRASYFDITVWGKTAENCAQYLSKGRPVAIQGRLRQDRWETDDGSKRSAVKITADTVQFLSRAGDTPGGSNGGGGAPTEGGDNDPLPEEEPAAAGAPADDIPF